MAILSGGAEFYGDLTLIAGSLVRTAAIALAFILILAIGTLPVSEVSAEFDSWLRAALSLPEPAQRADALGQCVIGKTGSPA